MDDESPTSRDDVALYVVIIGGSLAGLMHGIMLRQLGHNVHIFERASSSVRESQAAGITAGPHVGEFFEKYDTCDAPWFLAARGAKILNKACKVRVYRKMSLQNTSWDVLYHRMRAIFDGLASEHYPTLPLRTSENNDKESFKCGRRVTGVVDAEATVIIEYEELSSRVKGSVSADLVVVAGGAGCEIRSLLLPDSDLQRPYSGYLVWRGTVQESDVSEETKRHFGRENTLFVGNQTYVIVYTIPGASGSLELGKRILNFVWYWNCTEDSLTNVLTDVNGHNHKYFIPPGGLREEIWAKQKAKAREMLPPPFLELTNKIQQPFVTVISDTTASNASFFGGKVLLVGDALTLFRPHNALSSNQAAFDCLELRKALKGDISLSEWENRVLQYAHLNRLRAISWGSYFQVGWLAYIKSEMDFRQELVRQWLVNRWHRREI